MTKGSGTKKKKASPNKSEPDPGKSMPRIPRTPQHGQDQPQAPAQSLTKTPDVQAPAAQSDRLDGGALERLLVGMEGRLTSKIGSTNRAVGEAVSLAKQTNDALEALEEKVDDNEAALRLAIERCEQRMMDKLQATVKDLVNEQLKAIGFDPDLSAGALSTNAPSAGRPMRRSRLPSFQHRPGRRQWEGRSSRSCQKQARCNRIEGKRSSGSAGSL